MYGLSYNYLLFSGNNSQRKMGSSSLVQPENESSVTFNIESNGQKKYEVVTTKSSQNSEMNQTGEINVQQEKEEITFASEKFILNLEKKTPEENFKVIFLLHF